MDYREIMSEANRQRAAGAGRDALGPLGAILAEHGWLGEVAALMGKIHFSEGRYGYAEGCFSLATMLQPSSQEISFGRFLSLWEGGRINAALEEVSRFSQAGQATAYDPLMKSIVDYLDEELGGAFETESELSLESPGAYSRAASGLPRRYHEDRNPVDHLDGLRRKQQMIRHGQTKGLIDETKKSEQDVNNELGRIRSRADLDDSPVTKQRTARR